MDMGLGFKRKIRLTVLTWGIFLIGVIMCSAAQSLIG